MSTTLSAALVVPRLVRRLADVPIRRRARVGAGPDHRGTPTFGVTVDDTSRRLLLSGDFDLAAVDTFTGAAAGLAAGRRGDVTVDLGAVGFVDASALGALVTLQTALVRHGRVLHVRHANPRVSKIFTLGGLPDMVTPGNATGAQRNGAAGMP